MAKLPAKFTAQQILDAGDWRLEELVGAKKISTTSSSKQKKISARDTGIDPSEREKRPTFADRKAVLKKSAQNQNQQQKSPQSAEVKQTTTREPQVPAAEVEERPLPEQSPQAAADASQIETLLDSEDQAIALNDDPLPITDSETEVADQDQSEARTVNNGNGDDGYAEGFKKGETEGFVKGEQAGYQAGLEAGTSAGREAAEKAFSDEVATQRGVLNDLIQAFSSQQDVTSEYEQALLPLIVQISQVVLMGELKTEPEHIQRLIRNALAVLPHSAKNIKAFVNPSDLEWLQDSVKPEVELVPDASLARGGCRIENPDSKIDASLSHRLTEALVATWEDDSQVEAVSEHDLQQIESALDS